MGGERKPWAQAWEMRWGESTQNLVPLHPLQPPLLPGARPL